ncbi:phosphatidate cytidylyltransferase [Stylonychia lemnae]|uniref:Phosphatidate cytidylyltransferase n=1 Tax=Stylonychia lemnae TaxID=5949 RepID=A0A078B547_STYLE|nr:phosphatidate cytidylyltransferase [Stylonychia lemnae]|eukprot:CDW89544.1 phosphatidate cytidylyltransferase [Stylonychia lemnae]
MMQKTLNYVGETCDQTFVPHNHQLINVINDKYWSIAYLFLIHLFAQLQDSGKILLLHSMVMIVIIFVKFYHYNHFMHRKDKPKFIAITFCLAWQADNGGLFFGSAFGSRPFAQSLSPKKTREGIIGAFFLCFVSSLLMWVIAHYISDFLYVKIGLLDYAIIGAVSGVLAVLSDLTESFMKRCANVKDSSSFFPGHGGFFDRLDSILLPLVFVYWYMNTYLKYTFITSDL